MIKFQEQVPSVYPSASRDFQYLSWLINIVLNSVKHNVDDLYNLPNTQSDPKLTELLAMTLGFKVKRNYDQKQLAALVAVLPRILKYKGTDIAIEMAGNALIAASGAQGSFISEISDGVLEVTFPKDLIDISLFTDLLPYILPAGMTCRIIRTDIIKKGIEENLSYADSAIFDIEPDFDFDWQVSADPDKLRADFGYLGLANMYPVTSDEFTLSNYISNENESKFTLNVGLLANTIILDGFTETGFSGVSNPKLDEEENTGGETSSEVDG